MADTPQTREPNARTTQRLEAFSDGVFAIAITLLVLEIKVPELQSVNAGGAESLSTALLDLWTSYFAYVFSFVTIGIFWANHHHNFEFYFKRTDQTFNLLNLLFLMCISFLPFPTAVLARYITGAHEARHTAIIFYALGLFLPTAAWLLLWLYGSRRGSGLLDEKLDEKFIRRLTRQYLLTSALFLSAVATAWLNGTAGLVFCVALTLIHLFPTAARLAASRFLTSG